MNKQHLLFPHFLTFPQEKFAGKVEGRCYYFSLRNIFFGSSENVIPYFTLFLIYLYLGFLFNRSLIFRKRLLPLPLIFFLGPLHILTFIYCYWFYFSPGPSLHSSLVVAVHVYFWQHSCITNTTLSVPCIPSRQNHHHHHHSRPSSCMPVCFGEGQP